MHTEQTANIDPSGNPDQAWVIARRQANDEFRRSLTGGTVMLTAGVVALGAKAQADILDAIRNVSEFDADDPSDAHDIGDVEIRVDTPTGEAKRLLIFFRIDHDPTGPALTIMLASEW